jgi:hypothetical protein
MNNIKMNIPSCDEILNSDIKFISFVEKMQENNKKNFQKFVKNNIEYTISKLSLHNKTSYFCLFENILNGSENKDKYKNVIISEYIEYLTNKGFCVQLKKYIIDDSYYDIDFYISLCKNDNMKIKKSVSFLEWKKIESPKISLIPTAPKTPISKSFVL